MGITKAQAFDLFNAMFAKTNKTTGLAVLNASEAYNTFSSIKNEKPELTNAVSAKLTALTNDKFDQIDPLGVRDGLIDVNEFAKFLSDDSSIVTSTTRGADTLAKADTFVKAGYTSATGGKNDSQTASANVVSDFEGLLGDANGSKINGNLNKADLQKAITKWEDAGLQDKKAVAVYLLENYDQFKNGTSLANAKNGGADDISIESMTKQLKTNTEFWS